MEIFGNFIFLSDESVDYYCKRGKILELLFNKLCGRGVLDQAKPGSKRTLFSSKNEKFNFVQEMPAAWSARKRK